MASSAVGFALSKLGGFLNSEVILVFGLQEEIGHVKMKLECLGVFLADADHKRRDERHESVRVWVNHLREVAYDLEDVLDEYTVKLDSQRMGFLGWLHCCISHVTQPFTCYMLTSKIRQIKVTLEEIERNKATFLDRIDLSSSSQEPSSTYRRINHLRNEVEAEPTGQNTNVEKLMPKILKINAQRVSIISICGMGGLGKTTLAKRLYNDTKVVSHFNLHAWLTISQTFSIVDLLRRLMTELNVEGDTSNEDEMKIKIKDHLHEKRFIIVLDDMWDINAWDSLKTIFPREHEGIAVILTTRDKKLATIVNPDDEPFDLQHLGHEESWQLFCRKAFVDAHCPTNFQEFKEEVIERCKGLPLAITVLGGILRIHKEPYQWKKVLDHPRCVGDVAESILYLSYDYLHHQLKACFLYIAGYPEDFEIDAEELIRMWIAEGFIQQQEEYTMENLAEDYLEELIQRSLIQIVKRDIIGRVSVIRVHDLVLDMARNEVQEINFLYRSTLQQSSTICPRLIRRLSLFGEDNIRNYSTSKLRSLRCIELKNEAYLEYFNFGSTKFLRVLSLMGIRFASGTRLEAICNLIQLKYLRFCFTYISKEMLNELPKNISNLQNLQTLDIRDTNVKQLPRKFWEIASLRHVMGAPNLQINPLANNKLKELQTLRGRPNYEWIMEDGLYNLSNIRTLCIYGVYAHGIHNIELEKLEEKLIDAIGNLKHLTWLELKDELASKKVLTVRNTPLRHLEMLYGKITSGEQQQNRQKSLPNLSSLRLVGMSLTQNDIDVIGLLPNLKSLEILSDQKLTNLEMGFEKDCFFCLEELTLHRCYKLESWGVKEGSSKSTKKLQRVTIMYCPELKLLPQPQVLAIKEIQLRPKRDYANEIALRDEVRLWAKQMSEGPTKTIVISHDY